MTEEEQEALAVAKFKPVQHPSNLHGEDLGIVSYKVPPKNLTPYYKVPDLALMEADQVFYNHSPPGSRSIEACLLGAPNAGKSSLLNAIVGKGVSAVSNKYNTTDEVSRGIYTDIDERTQLVLLDTPGVIKMN